MGGYYFPMFVDISTKRILVIGGGKIAARRVRTLLKFAEHIEVTAPEICDEMKDILKEEEKNGNWIMTEEKMACLMEKGYLKRFKKEFPERFVIGALNQADTKEAEETGRNILKRTGQEQGILTGKLYEEPSFDLF